MLVPSTLRALDWSFVLERLARHARTVSGAAAARLPDFAQDLSEIQARYREVGEVWALEQTGEHIPTGQVHDIEIHLERASHGELLELFELEEVASCVRALSALQRWLVDAAADAPSLAAHAAAMPLVPALEERLNRSLDGAGNLVLSVWTELAELKRRVESSRARIQRTMEELVRNEGLGDILQDRYFTERDGRFVLPVKAQHRRGRGIVHGRSQSGETFFIEPAEVVELTNDLREAEREVVRETRRILALLSREVGVAAPGLRASLILCTRIDLAIARAGLGRELHGEVPEVGTGGVIDLRRARHPVLALRGVNVVANDLHLDGAHPALVLTGPNTGGKTVAMKTLGLAALFVRAGLPFPAGEGSRIDLFPDVVADIGDAQTLEQDLSTFSGHVVVLREILASAGPGTLALLDEITAGTDPAQGAALARAVLEALVEAGARVACTTHFVELKAMGLADRRFTVGAVLYQNERPTYQLAMGLAGDSHAFAIARHLGLPAAVMTRARDLLSPAAAAISELLESLEAERERGRLLQERLADEERDLRAREARAEARAAELDKKAEDIRTRLSEGFQQRLRDKEREIKKIIADLQATPTMRDATAALDLAREARIGATPPRAQPVPRPPASVAVGDAVTVRAIGQRGKVLSVGAGGQLELEVGRLRMRARVDEVDAVAAPGAGRGRQAKKLAPIQPAEKSEAAFLGGMRRTGNTLDLRGQRVEEAIDNVESFLAELSQRGEPLGWILHGHGTGALKQAVRESLRSSRYARRARPADQDEGGDAFTVVEVVGLG